jgi:L-aminoadipate-semialdehyde dehydrogenase
MPLNPNGKIDKPALPFPDTAQAASVEPTGVRANSTVEVIESIWRNLLPTPPAPIPLDESFFDLGGHSILATRLIFELRKAFVVEAPLGLVFERPTINGLAPAIDALRNADLGLNYKEQATNSDAEKLDRVPEMPKISFEYGQDYEMLVKQLRPEYRSLPSSFGVKPITVFLTGATGFLGSFILQDLLGHNQVKKVYCLVRALDSANGLDRLQQSARDRGVWSDEWITSSRLEVLTGDLDQKMFGLDQSIWDIVAAEVDVVIHNGALVGGLIFFSSFNLNLVHK